MGIDYVQLNKETVAIPAPVFPWAVGKDDDAWPAGDGGGTNTTFVQEDAVTNPLPGSKTSTDTSADNDYYFGGNYTNVLAANGTYEGVGIVSANEEGAERALTTALQAMAPMEGLAFSPTTKRAPNPLSPLPIQNYAIILICLHPSLQVRSSASGSTLLASTLLHPTHDSVFRFCSTASQSERK